MLEIALFRRFHVRLTSDAAISRGARRRVVPWGEVMAVEPVRRFGEWRVRLALRDAPPVTRRVPSSYWGIDRKRYHCDYHRIGQWWQAHSVNAATSNRAAAEVLQT